MHRSHRVTLALFLGTIATASAVAACGDDPATDDDDDDVVDAAADGPGPDASLDAAIDAFVDPLAPLRLEDSGLWSDFAGEVLADGVRPFAPSYGLWSDGAAKRRWIYLPPGSQIDTSDMNYWVYPVGTKLWKEFTRDEIRVETRLLLKTDEDSWYRIAFQWNPEGTATEAVPSPGADDVVGTAHDVPSRLDCDKCHRRMPDNVLGFSALALDHLLADDDTASLNLDRLIDEGWLTAPPAPQVDGGDTYFTIPGDPTTRDALGYLHVNCGGCHHPQSTVLSETDMLLRLDVAPLADPLAIPEDTTIWQSTVEKPNTLTTPGAPKRVASGDPSSSSMFVRMDTRGGIGMPPLGTEDVDETALATVEGWILSLAK